MTRLISVDQAKTYARITTADADAEVQVLIEAASGAVIAHLESGEAYLDFLDSDGLALDEDSDGVAQEIPPVVQAACMYLFGWLYRHRDGDPENNFPDGHLPYPVRALLGPLRKPVMG